MHVSLPRLKRLPNLIAATAIALGACEPTANTSTLHFDASFNGQPLSCKQPLQPGLALTDLRLYVSKVQVQTLAGHWQDVTPAPGVHLLDFEDGSAACTNGSPERITKITLSMPEESQGLRFELGVPFEQNHADPLGANAPLNNPAMHWHWRSGYKFLRAGVAVGNKRWHAHLGSVGCRGPVTAVEGCDRPNRVLVSLPDWTDGTPVEIKFDQLIAGIDPADAKTAHCLATEDNESCRQIGSNLGLDFETGQQTHAGRVFVLGRRP